MEPLHEFFPVAIHEAAAFSAHRLRNQEAAIRRKQRGWMELYVLHVDAASPGAISHGDAIAACTRWIRRMKEDAAKAAARENGLLGQHRKNLSGRLVEDIRPNAGKRPIDVRGFNRVVRCRQEIHRGGV